MNPVLVEVTRAGRIESAHRGAIAICDARGRVFGAWGDVDAAVYPRSAFKSLQALNEEIARLAGEWDQRYADIHDYQIAAKHHIVKIDWWDFLTADGPVTPIDGLRDGDVLQLLNSFMTPERFKLLDRSPEQFLIERWHEAERNDAVKQFRELRKRTLKDIPRTIALLDRNSLY